MKNMKLPQQKDYNLVPIVEYPGWIFAFVGPNWLAQWNFAKLRRRRRSQNQNPPVFADNIDWTIDEKIRRNPKNQIK